MQIRMRLLEQLKTHQTTKWFPSWKPTKQMQKQQAKTPGNLETYKLQKNCTKQAKKPETIEEMKTPRNLKTSSAPPAPPRAPPRLPPRPPPQSAPPLLLLFNNL